MKFRFTRWYSLKTGHKGGLWESRFSSTLVKEEERALPTIAAYIDLNPVRPVMVADPADYRWSDYEEALAGKARARGGCRALGRFRFSDSGGAMGTALLQGHSGRTGDSPDRGRWHGGAPCGVGKKQERLTTPNERRLTAEVLTCQVQHLTTGVIVGSRVFIDGWFARHQSIVAGRSRTERQRGSNPLGRPALRGLYSFRNPRI